MPDSRTIWKRRVVLMTIVGLIIAVPLTIAIRGGDGERPSRPGTGGPPDLGKVTSDRKLGVTLRVPKGWKRERRAGALTLRDRDGGALIAVSSPGPAEDSRAIQDEAVAEVKSQYRKVEVESQTRKLKLGGRRAITAVISAKHPRKGGSLRILVATAKGRKKAYLVEVLAPGPGEALVEAQALLNTLELTG